MGTHRAVAGALVLLCSYLLLAGAAPAASAATAKPSITTVAWYWENQQHEEVKDQDGNVLATVTIPNQFCPGADVAGAPEPTCKPGRLPIEVVGGDYETPDKVSAVAFDLAAVPLGSKVTRFRVTFAEASDPQSQPVNAEVRRIEACLVNDIFGDGDARRYKEVPKHVCDKKTPILAERKEVKAKKEGGDPTFEWTFDLTGAAKKWVAKGAFATGILLRPAEPKNAGPADADWRVVLTGPADKGGVVTELDYIPAKTTDPGGSFGGGFGGGGSSGSDFGSGSSDFGSGSIELGGGAPKLKKASGTEPVDTSDTKETLAADLPEVPGGLPAYAWLAVLVGLAGFSMLRSVVLDRSVGVRPDGVLAQIRRLNAERRGDAGEPAATGGAVTLAVGARLIAGRLGDLAARLRRGRKG